MIRRPKLLNADLTEKADLHPSDESITLHLHSPHQAQMVLPDGDPDVALHDWVRLYTADGYDGFFMVNSRTNDVGNAIRLGLRHGICILARDKPRFGETIYGTLAELMNRLWTADGVSTAPVYWTLGTIPDTDVLRYEPSGENLLQAVETLLKTARGYRWQLDQSVFPWVANVVPLTDTPTSEGRFSRNLSGVEINEDDYELVTRVYLAGREGYADADTIDQWGVFSEELTVGEDATEESIAAYVADYLEAHKNPTVSIRLNAVDMSGITGERVDHFRLGDLCRACLQQYNITLLERIVSIEYPDVYGMPDTRVLSMSNKVETTPDLLVIQEQDISSAQRLSGGARAIAEQTSIELTRTKEDLTDTRYRMAQAGIVIDKDASFVKTFAYQETVEAQSKIIQNTQIELTSAISRLKTVEEQYDDVNNAVAGAVGEIETLAGEVAMRAYNYTVDELGKRVRDNETYIKALPGLLEAKADVILLEGYVKAESLSAEIAEIQKFFSGESYAESMGISGNLYAQNVNFPGNVSLKNRAMNLVDMTMGTVASHTFLGAGTGTKLNLEHSHTIEYDAASGKFTLAGVSSSGGSFSIADTQFYKDGVAAAAGLVTLSAQGWVGKQNTVKGTNGKTATVLLPDMTVKTVDEWNSLHKTYARLGYRDTAGKTVEAGYIEVNASDVYLAGKEAGMQEAGTDYTEGYEKGKKDWNPVELRREEYSAEDKTVFVRAVNAENVSLLWANIDASEIYEEGERNGANDVTLEQSGWINGQNTVMASNQRTETVILPTFSASVDAWNSLHKTYVRLNYKNANGNTQQAAMAEVDASSVYLLGKDDGIEEAETGYEQGKTDWMPVEIRNEGYELEDFEVHLKAYNQAGVPVIDEYVNVYEMYEHGRDEVSLSQTGWVGRQNTVKASNGRQATVLLPNLYINEDEWLTNNTKPVYITMTDKNGDPISLDSAIIDGSTIHTKGKNSVTVSQTGWVGKQNTVKASNGQQTTVLLPNFSATLDAWNSLHKTNVHIKYTDSLGTAVEAIYVGVDASEIYEAGQDSVTLAGDTGWKDGTFLVTASNNEKYYVGLPGFETSGGTSWLNNKTTVYFSTPSVNVPLKSVEVDASVVYSNGYKKGETDWTPKTIVRTAYDTDKKTVTVRADNQAGVPVLALEEIDASEIWQAGFDNVYISSTEWSYEKEQCVVTASNGAIGYVGIPGMYCSAGEWSELWKKTVNCYTYTSPNVQASIVIDAKPAYDKGQTDWQPETITRTGYSAANKTVTVRAENAAGVPVLGGQVIDASEIYTKGQTDWQPTGMSMVSYDAETKKLTVRAVNAAGVPVLMDEIDISTVVDKVVEGVYDVGWQDAFDAVRVGYTNLSAERLSTYSVRITGTVYANVSGIRAATGNIDKTLSM